MSFVTNKRTTVRKDKATCYAKEIQDTQQSDPLTCIRQRSEIDGKQHETLRQHDSSCDVMRNNFDPRDCTYHVVNLLACLNNNVDILNILHTQF